MKVLIADTFEQPGIDALQAAGCDVIYAPDLVERTLGPALWSSAADVLIVRSTRVNADAFDAPMLSLVVRAGAGVNTIDVAAASRRGVYVSTCPGRNAIAVAELTFGLILALDRRIPDNVADLRAGRWNKQEYSKARGLYGRSLGLIGFGNIGQEVARRGRAFGMPVLVWSRRFLDAGASAAGGGLSSDLEITVIRTPEELAERSDVLSVHLALEPQTRNFVGHDILGRLKPGSIFINTARAELVDADALAGLARGGGVRVGLDVHAGEPASASGEFSDSLAMLSNVYGTHHIGASTQQAQEAIAAETVRVIRSYKETGRVPNVVNLSKTTPATHRLVVRHRDRPGVLAHVFDRLRESRLNVQETENVIFEGAEAAVARINLDAEPTASVLQAIAAGNEHILNLHVVKL